MVYDQKTGRIERLDLWIATCGAVTTPKNYKTIIILIMPMLPPQQLMHVLNLFFDFSVAWNVVQLGCLIDGKSVAITVKFSVEVDQYIGRYLGYTDISASAKTADFIGLSRCSRNAVIFLTHADNLHKKAQRIKSRQLSCSNASRCLFISKHTRWTMEPMSVVAGETEPSSLIRLIKNHSKILKWLQFEKF